MTDETHHLRDMLKGALKEVEDLRAERDRLARRVQELEQHRPTPAVDVYDLHIHHEQETCPWTGWPA